MCIESNNNDMSGSADEEGAPKRPLRRKVQFHQYVKKYSVMHRKHWSEEERMSSFFVAEDYAAMRQRDRDLVKFMLPFRRELANKDGDDGEIGLESSLEKKDRKRRVSESVSCVLLEQEFQKEMEDYDPEALARVLRCYSALSSWIAYDRAYAIAKLLHRESTMLSSDSPPRTSQAYDFIVRPGSPTTPADPRLSSIFESCRDSPSKTGYDEEETESLEEPVVSCSTSIRVPPPAPPHDCFYSPVAQRHHPSLDLQDLQEIDLDMDDSIRSEDRWSPTCSPIQNAKGPSRCSTWFITE